MSESSEMHDQNLSGIGHQAERHWRRHRSRLVKALEADGTLHESLKEAEESAQEMYEQLLNQGVNPVEAMSMAMREFVILPDIAPSRGRMSKTIDDPWVIE